MLAGDRGRLAVDDQWLGLLGDQANVALAVTGRGASLSAEVRGEGERLLAERPVHGAIGTRDIVIDCRSGRGRFWLTLSRAGSGASTDATQ